MARIYSSSRVFMARSFPGLSRIDGQPQLPDNVSDYDVAHDAAEGDHQQSHNPEGEEAEAHVLL